MHRTQEILRFLSLVNNSEKIDFSSSPNSGYFWLSCFSRIMDLTHNAFGTWSGGRFMHFGESLTEERFISLIRLAYDSGIRTFVTSDVYGVGRADQILGQALNEFDRESYCLVGMLGHDIYEGKREGSKGYPRFSDPSLRSASEYSSYLKMAAEKSLKNCSANKFDLIMLHNPDEKGYNDPAVWDAMSELKVAGFTDRLGIAPGPANGFTLDLLSLIHI